jgi:uncharacterized protein (DUF2252 family)
VSGQRKALIVANDEYQHEGLRHLLAPAADAEALGQVLGDPRIGNFAVQVVRNEPSYVVQAQIDELFTESRSEDVLLLHFSCHGLKSESGELFFAAVNTRPDRLGSTAIPADFVQRCMQLSRSRSIVLLLDCCYGGAFAKGVTVRASGDVNVLDSFPQDKSGGGRGRAVITASSAMEYAFEGDQLADDHGPRPSVFTTALVEGLATGEADRDQDGWVSLNELYDYVFDKVRERNPHQTPSRDIEMQGELYIARRTRPVTTPAPLPPELQQVIDHPLAAIRLGAVQELVRTLQARHAGLALAARLALEHLAEDDSRAVSAAADAVLNAGAQPTEAARPTPPRLTVDTSVVSVDSDSGGGTRTEPQPLPGQAKPEAEELAKRRTPRKSTGSEAPPRLAKGYQLDSALRLTPAERVARGKAARAAVPLDSHAVFDPPSDRPNAVSLLAEQAESLVPELIPVRWGRMTVSPFTFYRGAALLMASDLASTPVSGLAVQACGDAHLSNFGIFGSDEGRLVFDVSDFDETLPGPWEWDVKRLGASMEVAARENGFPVKDRHKIVTATVASYRQAMRTFRGMSTLGVWYAHADLEQLRAQFESRLVNKGLATARTSNSRREAAKLTHMVDGRLRIISDPPLLVPIDELISKETDRSAFMAQLSGLIAGYRRTLETDYRFLLEQFEVGDMARMVVGVGSVGTRCWIILMLGHDESDPLFLQVKEAKASVFSRFVGASKYANQGQRVVAGQRLTQATSDIFLGWQRTKADLDGQPRDFYVRQLRDWKYRVDTQAMAPSDLQMYGELCGWTLARAHARSGDRIAIAAYLGASEAFDNAITQFAVAYADQTERDHRAFVDAITSGRITADRVG